MVDSLGMHETPIPGVLLFDLPVHGDSRGWFKENWQRQKMVELGLPDFRPVQNNVSFNEGIGTTRGIHAEPWDKFISVAAGRIFGAWVDLREGDTFGTVFTAEIDESKAIYVPRGVGNAYQTLEPGTTYTYLVNDHWSAEASYTFVNLADETLAIEWPIPLSEAELSTKDKEHPALAEVIPVGPKRLLILGASGQLGQALLEEFPEAEAWTREQFDIADPERYLATDWRAFDVVINAAAYTRVDEAETLQGRREAWRTNVTALVHLARAASANDLTLVHVSSDYVFDGEVKEHTVDEAPSPLGVYGQTKAAGDAVVMTVPKHFIVRTSWVVGAGTNFVDTMRRLARDGVRPSVVNDQVGRLTHTSDIAKAIRELLTSDHPYGVCNVSGSGQPMSWYEIAREVFAQAGRDPDDVIGVTTSEYGQGRNLAPRPRNSALVNSAIAGREKKPI